MTAAPMRCFELGLSAILRRDESLHVERLRRSGGKALVNQDLKVCNRGLRFCVARIFAVAMLCHPLPSL